MNTNKEYIPREDKIEQAIDYLRNEVMDMTEGDPEKRLRFLGYLTQIGLLISERYNWG